MIGSPGPQFPGLCTENCKMIEGHVCKYVGYLAVHGKHLISDTLVLKPECFQPTGLPIAL